MKINERKNALDALIKILQNKANLSFFLPNLTPFSRELCFGVCRQFYNLEALADQLVTKRPKKLEIWLILLLGLYELHYLKRKEYAVVKEAVNLVPKQYAFAKGFVNATLRQYCNQPNRTVESVGHPPWLVASLQKDYPEIWQRILTESDNQAPMILRVNQLQWTRDDYIKKLQSVGIQANPHAYAPEAIILTEARDVTELPNFKEGACSVQDAAAQFAAHLLDLKPGLRVLDACAAPGGKTGHILELENNLAACVAVEVERKRIERIHDNLTRLKVKATVHHADASQPNTWWDGKPFDRILLDAPCSATGVIRRHPDIKILRTSDEVRQIAQIQSKLLNALWPLLSTEGRLVYATCSLLSRENDQQIEQFLQNNKDCVLVNLAEPWARSTQYGLQILPGDHQMDGFYYTVLSKK